MYINTRKDLKLHDGSYKISFHLVFPNITIKGWKSFYFILNKLLKMNKKTMKDGNETLMKSF